MGFKVNDKVTFELKTGGRGTGEIVGSEAIGNGVEIFSVLAESGHYHKFLGQHLTPVKPKAVRSISRKLADIAEAGWEAGDAHAEGDDYGQLGTKAIHRVERMARQIRELAVQAIVGRYSLGDDATLLLRTSPHIETILAEALVGDWAKVERLLPSRTTAAQEQADEALEDPITKIRITLEPRDPASPLNFPCCGGLRPAHKSTCRRA